MVGLLPTGLGPGKGDDPLVSLFVSTRAEDVGAARAGGLARWKDEVRALAPATAPVLDSETPLFQSDQDLLGRARDALFGPASAIGFVEREW